MSPVEDPLLMAVQTGDPRCPDGRALARLGALVRRVAQPLRESDLRARVLAGCAAVRDAPYEDAEAGGLGAAVDAVYGGVTELADPLAGELLALKKLVREAAAPVREVDLLPKLEGRFQDRGSTRRLRVQVDGATHWRIWTAVIAGHIAAVLALAWFHFRMSDAVAYRPEEYELLSLPPSAIGADAGSSDGWRGLEPAALTAARRDAASRQHARRRHGLDGSAPLVHGGVAWLAAQRDPASGAIGPLSGHAAGDAAVQALACLALAGEGGGETPSDQRRRAALGGVAGWLEREPVAATLPLETQALVLWALVDADLVLGDASTARRVAIAKRIDAIAAEASIDAPSARQAGMALLAVSLAQAVGAQVPIGLRPRLDALVRRTGLGDGIDAPVVLARQLSLGVDQERGSAITLANRLPALGADGRIDVWALMTATMVVRELGGQAWHEWAGALQGLLSGGFVHDHRAHAWLPGEEVRYASATGRGADVFATSVALISLQVAYRYPPL